MNDKRFIELINLFVDHEISAAESAELEREIMGNPARRRVYQQYCKINKASVVLAGKFQAGSALAESKFANSARNMDTLVSRGVVRKAKSFSWAWISGLGMAAAAACVAFVLVRHDASSGAAPLSSPVVAQQAPVPQAPAPQVKAKAIAPIAATSGFNATLVAQTDATGAQSGPSLAWVDRLEIPAVRRVSTEDLSFETKAEPQDPRTFRSDRPMNMKVEMTAFQFQK